MSEAVPDPFVNEVSAALNSVTAGGMLRAARETSGLHIAALAVSMKVPVKKLEALEADRFDLLPDAVFVRALAASVCRALKIDAGPVLKKLPVGNLPKLNTTERGINAPFRARGEHSGWAVPDFLSKPTVITVIVLVLSAVAVAFFPESSPTETSQSVADTKPAEVAVATTVKAPALEAAALPAETLAPMSREPLTTVPQQTLAPVALATGAPSLLTLRTKGTSWVKVTDAKGIILLNKTMMAGEELPVSVPAPGSAPVFVVIGRVDVTEVEVRGRVFNLADVTKDNVARFEVK